MFSTVKELRRELDLKNDVIANMGREVYDLQAKLQDRDAEISRLKNVVKNYETLSDGTPEDCVRGVWCSSCAFRKEVIKHNISPFYNIESTFFCSKGESCKHYTNNAKKENNNA